MTYTNTLFDRNIGVWDEAFQDRLRSVCVGVAGVGGASHAAIDILARNGVGHFKLADPDTFEEHNLQRQILATQRDLGRNKATVVSDHLTAIHPAIQVQTYTEGLTAANLDDFLEDLDVIVEALDISAVAIKRQLYARARAQNKVVVTAPILAAGAGVLVFPPDGMSFEEYFDFQRHHETLSPHRLAARIPDYLQPNFFARMQEGIVPTTCDGAHLSGVLAAGVIKRLLWGKEVAGAPILIQFDMLDEQLYQQAQFHMGITPLFPLEDGIYLKLEGHNPTGSSKYHLARHLLEEAIQRGEVQPDQTVIEASSGNAGVALAMFAQKHNRKAEIYVSPDVAPALRQRIHDYGGVTHTFAGSPQELAALLQQRVTDERCFWPNQYTNPEAARSYQKLWSDLQRQLDDAGLTSLHYFVAALGTGGTLMGLGPFLRQHYHAALVCVESDPNDPIPGLRNSHHQHLGAIDIYDTGLPDHTVIVRHSDALAERDRLHTQGVDASASTAACLLAVQQLRQPDEAALILSADGTLIQGE